MAEQRLQVVLRLNFPYGEIGRDTGALLSLSDRDGVLDGAPVKLGWEYADNRVNDLQERDRDVDRAVARIFAARARQEAIGRNRAGDYQGAKEVLSGVVPPDPRLRRPRHQSSARSSPSSTAESDRMAAPMSAAVAQAGVLRQRQHGPDAHLRRQGDEGARRPEGR